MSMTNEKILEEFDCFGECTECEVCEYLGYLDWAETVGNPEGSVIEENIRVETYLKKKEASINQARTEERERVRGEIKEGLLKEYKGQESQIQDAVNYISSLQDNPK